MNKYLDTHRYRYDSSQILISLIIELTHITGPKSQTCNDLLMFLKIFHPSTIPNIDSKNTASAISHKQLPLTIVQYNRSQLMSTYITIDTHQLACLHIPYLHRIRMQCHYAEKGGIEKNT